MNEPQAHLDREARRVDANDDALAQVRRRAQQHHRRRRVVAGVIALAMAGAGVGLSYAAFQGPDEPLPAGPPTLPQPGPSGSPPSVPPHSRSNPIVINILNATGVRGPASTFATSKLSAIGMTGHKGYEIHAGDLTTSQPPREDTLIYYDPRYEADALRIREALSPGAELRHLIAGEVPIRIVLGKDYTQENTSLLPFIVLQDFMEARMDGQGAETFLDEVTQARYAQQPDGLSLYGYATTPGAHFEIGGFRGGSSGPWSFTIEILAPGGDPVREKIELKKDHSGTTGAPSHIVTFARRSR